MHVFHHPVIDGTVNSLQFEFVRTKRSVRIYPTPRQTSSQLNVLSICICNFFLLVLVFLFFCWVTPNYKFATSRRFPISVGPSSLATATRLWVEPWRKFRTNFSNKTFIFPQRYITYTIMDGWKNDLKNSCMKIRILAIFQYNVESFI